MIDDVVSVTSFPAYPEHVTNYLGRICTFMSTLLARV